MADDPIEKLRRRLDPPKPAVPPTYPGRLAMGKIAVPPPKTSEPLPVALPVKDEETRVDGMLGPAPGLPPPTAPQPAYRRIPSPNPAPLEEAPNSEPESVHEARRAAKAKVADQERRQAEELAAARAELAALRRAVKPTDYKGIALVVTAIGGVAATVIASVAAKVPPAVLECPARLDELERKVKNTTTTVENAEDDLKQAKKDWRKTDEKAEEALGEITKLRRAVPRIEGVKPEP